MIDGERLGEESSEGPSTAIYGSVAQSFTTGTINNVYGRLAMTSSLDDDSIGQLRKVFVRPSGWDVALERISARGAVALVAEPGSGRRITAVNLLTSRTRRVRELLLTEGDDLDRHFTAEPECGYILAVPDKGYQGQTLNLVNDYLEKVRRARSLLVVLANRWAAQDLELERRGLAVPIRAVDGESVFHRTLEVLRDRAVADEWSRYPGMISLFRGATPADAYRLATLVQAVLEGRHDDAPLTEVINAYGQWLDEIIGWEKKSGEDLEVGRDRAVLLAVAALEGCRPAVVFEAAQQLMGIAGMTRPEESALTGPGVRECLARVSAEISDGGVTFNRTGYGRAVLDHVWNDRPGLQPALTRWLCEGEQAGGALLELAERQGDAEPVLELAQAWTLENRWRAAARVLAVAATSQSIGRATRRRMYEWAVQPGADQRLHFLVADVCSGGMAISYPDVALVRLRHLANRDNSQVRAAVTEAVLGLARERRIGFQLECAVVEWTQSEHPVRAGAGAQIFLSLADLQVPDGVPLMISRLPGPEATWVLAEGWRSVLRDPLLRERSREIAGDWIEAALESPGLRDPIVRVFAEVGRRIRDAALVSPVVAAWFSRDDDPAPPERVALYTQIRAAIHARDGLTSRRAWERPEGEDFR